MWATLAMMGLSAYQQAEAQRAQKAQAQQQGQASAWDAMATQQSPQSLMAGMEPPPAQRQSAPSPWVGADMGNQQQSPWMGMA